MELIPPNIWGHLIHSQPTAHITGVRNLFDYLNSPLAAGTLRQLVVDYFDDRPPLQPLLRKPLSRSFHHILQ